MAQKNSFHAHSPTISATVRSPGQASGRTTRNAICRSDAPSSRAASVKSLGIFNRNDRNSRVANGASVAQ